MPTAYANPMAQGAPMAQAVPIGQFGQPAQQTMGGQFGGAAPGMPMDPWALLQDLQRVNIKEKVQLAEVLVGFEMPNKYMIKDPQTGCDLFVAAEKSEGILGVLGRNVMEGGDRPFNMDIALMPTVPNQPPTPFVSMERPFKCTCCCFQRPEVFVRDAQTGQPIGSLTDPFACCMMTFDVKDNRDNAVLEINQSCCNCALCCWGCPCGCQEAVFDVVDKETKEPVGMIKKQFRMSEAMGMMAGIGVDASMYEVEFQKIQDPKWKALLLSLALFLDFRFFTKGGQDQRENSVLGRAVQTDFGGAGQALGGFGQLYGG